MPENIRFAFFGSSRISVTVLDELKARGFRPALLIAGEDKPQGRKMIPTPPETKVWAEENDVPVLQLATLRNPEAEQAIRAHGDFDVFIVASYGKLIPQNILDIPAHQCLNVHPSLLPKLRGPSPLQSAILSEDGTGVTIMRVDAEMDHGPILAQRKIAIEWPPYESELETAAGKLGGEMLADVLPPWIRGEIREIEQDHSQATVCQKIRKADGELDLSDDAEKNLRKIRAFENWPTAYYFLEKNGAKTRIIVKKAHIEDGTLVIDRIVPEGKKEMGYADYMRNI
jgi:methionyl-tRNA formyltransferase